MAVQISEWKNLQGMTFPRISGESPDLTTAFCEAASSLMGAITDVSRVEDRESVTIFCESSDSDWLFSDWINTLIYEVRERRMLFSRFEIEVFGINVKGKIFGEPISPARHARLRESICGAAFDELYAIEEGGVARVSAVLNDCARHSIDLRDLWLKSQRGGE